MTRTSSGAKKSGPPTHPNKFAFTHNRNSRLTKTILALPINGLCAGCRDVIEWRKRFRKYKPLSVPKRCVRCGERTVKEAYHVICKSCAIASTSCAKCLQSYTEQIGPASDAGQVLGEDRKDTMTGPEDAVLDADKDGEDESETERERESEHDETMAGEAHSNYN